ncbi:MAG TPA: glycosyltransferase family 4 protein [Anaerolineae bacterium]|nr:glycosyltransferase family 4 protein [Anaerolineae bacterium]
MVVHSYYPHDETRVERQVGALAKNGYHVDVVCLRDGDEPRVLDAANVTVYRLPVQRDKRRGALAQLLEYCAFLLLAAIQLTRLHLRARYDSVQVHNLPDFLVLAALVPRLTGSRVILDLHDLMPEFYCARFGKTMKSMPVRLLIGQEQLAGRFAHHIITVTEPWRQTLIARGVPPTKCSVVMNVADTQYFRSQQKTARAHAGGLSLIYHGTLTARYGIDLVLQAIAQLHNELPDLRLTIHGRGEYYESVRALINSLQLEDRVNLRTGLLSSDDLAALIRAHDVGVVPYRRDIFTDGILPTKLMEYMALGIPSLVARTPGISQYFDDTEVEFFTPEDINDLAQHLRILYRNPERREQLAQNTGKFNQKYNWTLQGERYVQLVKSLAKQSDKPGVEVSLAPEPLPHHPPAD